MSQESVEIVRSPGQLPISDRQLRRLLRYPGALALIFRLVVRVPPRSWPRRNVAISEAMMLPPDTNAAALMRDDALSSALVKAVTPLLHPTFEVGGTLLQSDATYAGAQGLREWARGSREARRRSRSSMQACSPSGMGRSPAPRSISTALKPSKPWA
jgi:hypothetical protein